MVVVVVSTESDFYIIYKCLFSRVEFAHTESWLDSSNLLNRVSNSSQANGGNRGLHILVLGEEYRRLRRRYIYAT